MSLTPKQFAEAVARHPKTSTRDVLRAKRLAEDMDGMGMGDAAVMDPPADDDGAGAITEAFKSAVIALVEKAFSGGMDKKTLLKKIAKLVDGHDDAQDTTGGDSGPDDAADGAAEESRKPAADMTREAIEVCRKVGFRGFDADDLDAIASVPVGRRESLARRLMGAAVDTTAEKPRSTGRDRAARLSEAKPAAGETPKPGSGEAFKKWVTESN